MFLKILYKKTKKKEQDIKNKEKNLDVSVSFVPEKVSFKSQITVLHASWGTGKTYFLEYLCKLIMKKEIETKYIDNIIFFDVWKYSGIDESVPKEFIYEFIKKFADLDLGEITKKVVNVFIDILNATILYRFNVAKSWNFSNLKKIKESRNLDNLVNKLKKSLGDKTILVILDNIERIGVNSWEIIKAIQKLSVVKNFIFLLPMDITKMYILNDGSGDELQITKYINTQIFSFEQNYLGFFINNGFNQEGAKTLNDLIHNIESKYYPSIREMQNVLVSDNENLKKAFDINKYEGIKEFLTKWKVKSDFLYQLVNGGYDDLFSILYELNDIYEKNIKYCLSNYEQQTRIFSFLKNQNINDENWNKKIEFLLDNFIWRQYSYINNFSYEWNNCWLNIRSFFEETFLLLENLGATLNKEISDFQKSIETSTNEIQQIEKQIKRFYKTKENLNAKVNLDDRDKEKLQRIETKINSLEQNILDIKNRSSNDNQNLLNSQNILNNLNSFIDWKNPDNLYVMQEDINSAINLFENCFLKIKDNKNLWHLFEFAKDWFTNFKNQNNIPNFDLKNYKSEISQKFLDIKILDKTNR